MQSVHRPQNHYNDITLSDVRLPIPPQTLIRTNIKPLTCEANLICRIEAELTGVDAHDAKNFEFAETSDRYRGLYWRSSAAMQIAPYASFDLNYIILADNL